ERQHRPRPHRLGRRAGVDRRDDATAPAAREVRRHLVPRRRRRPHPGALPGAARRHRGPARRPGPGQPAVLRRQPRAARADAAAQLRAGPAGGEDPDARRGARAAPAGADRAPPVPAGRPAGAPVRRPDGAAPRL
ncbi:MAG: hypothetical protein AVDCRST_MAG36-3068, partial [uncultured Nocardioidaceae bacterium]